MYNDNHRFEPGFYGLFLCKSLVDKHMFVRYNLLYTLPTLAFLLLIGDNLSKGIILHFRWYFMACITKVLEKKINGLRVNLFEFNIDEDNNLNEIKSYLKGKISNSVVHNFSEYDLTYYGSKNLNPDFVARFNACVSKINTPKKASIRQFDVRRERVTEWIAQYLLEQEFDCVFFDDSDKKINLKTVEIDKHTDGIDVPGLLISNNKIQFVVCEVKASDSSKIPCDSMTALQNDIQKSIDNDENRVSKEILEYMHGIRNAKIDEIILEKIIGFLGQLIMKEKKDMIEDVFFFPVILRSNSRIITEKNVDDYNYFSLNGVSGENVENVVASFRKNFSDFSNELYDEVMGSL